MCAGIIVRYSLHHVLSLCLSEGMCLVGCGVSQPHPNFFNVSLILLERKTGKLVQVESLRTRQNGPNYTKFELCKVSPGQLRACVGPGEIEKVWAPDDVIIKSIIGQGSACRIGEGGRKTSSIVLFLTTCKAFDHHC